MAGPRGPGKRGWGGEVAGVISALGLEAWEGEGEAGAGTVAAEVGERELSDKVEGGDFG